MSTSSGGAVPSIWSDPGVEDAGDGIFRIPLPLPGDGLRAVNVYALTNGDDIVLIDGGWAFVDSLGHLESGLRDIGADLAQVRQILVTHAHRDHYSQAVTVREKVGARVGLGEGEQDNVRASTAAMRRGVRGRSLDVLVRAGAGDLLRATGESTGTSVQPVWEDPDEWLTDGQDLDVAGRRLRAIATPGHTAGHLVFRDDARGQLFAGDHVLPHITPSIGFEAAPVRWPLRDYLASLQLMLELPDTRLLPAHGPIAGSVHDRVRELLVHHDDRLDATEAVVTAGSATGIEVASVLRWTRRGRSFTDLDVHNQQLAVSETMAHLDVLVLQDRARCAVGADGVNRYETSV